VYHRDTFAEGSYWHDNPKYKVPEFFAQFFALVSGGRVPVTEAVEKVFRKPRVIDDDALEKIGVTKGHLTVFLERTKAAEYRRGLNVFVEVPPPSVVPDRNRVEQDAHLVTTIENASGNEPEEVDDDVESDKKTETGCPKGGDDPEDDTADSGQSRERVQGKSSRTPKGATETQDKTGGKTNDDMTSPSKVRELRETAVAKYHEASKAIDDAVAAAKAAMNEPEEAGDFDSSQGLRQTPEEAEALILDESFWDFPTWVEYFRRRRVVRQHHVL